MSSETKENYYDDVTQGEVARKESRGDVFRRKYDFWPSFYQHSLRPKEDVIEARKGDFSSRHAFASQCKQKGNNCFSTGEFNDAIFEYERALSMFCWVEPLSPNWETEEIDDEKLEEFAYVAENSDEKKEMTSLQVSCYLNLAACYQKTKDWANSFEACNYAISIDSTSGRAYFRRAQARILPACTGSVGDEELLALCDLKVAHQLAPHNEEIARTYVNLSLAIEEHRRKEKELFKKAFKKTEEGKRKEEHTESGRKVLRVRSHKIRSVELGKKGSLKEVGELDRTECSAKGFGSNTLSTQNPQLNSSTSLKVKTPLNSATHITANPAEKPTAATAQASLKAALLTIEEAITRIKEVEDRAAELSREGRHAEALILSEKAKTAKLHIESMHVQQVKAEMIQREYFGTGESTEQDNSTEAEGGKELRLRGNLFAVDFLNPSPAIIEDARAQGLDLTDKRARRIMYELQKEAGISKIRALQWVQNGTPRENPEGKDDFVARVIDRVYREESRELAGKLVDGLSRGVLLGMLRSRRMSPPVDMGDSSYYALTADAKQLAAVVIAGAGAGVLTGLSTYELALANAKQERSALLAKARNWDKETSDSGTGAGAGALNAKSLTLPSGSSAGQRGNMVNSDSPTTTDDSPFSIERKGACESDGDTVTCTDMMMPSATQRDGDRADRNQSDGHDVDEEETKRIAEEREAEKEAEAEKKREQERENESPLEDMSRDELKERILPFLAGDLFLIWRETDLATEKEKLRVRNRLLHIEEDTNGVSEEVMEERRRIDAMSFDERAEYEKDKREEVVYTMLQVKYGLDEEKITDDAERLRNHSKVNGERLGAQQHDPTSPCYGMIVGAITFFVLLAMYTFFTISQQSPSVSEVARSIHSTTAHEQVL